MEVVDGPDHGRAAPLNAWDIPPAPRRDGCLTLTGCLAIVGLIGLAVYFTVAVVTGV